MRQRWGVWFVVWMLAAGAVWASGDDRRAPSREATDRFMAELRGELEEAMRQGGPGQALAVCQREAPRIAGELSREYGGEVGRTSLRVRNPGNAPDPWERSVLESFNARRAAGEDPRRMEHEEVVTEDGARVYRYMRAIPTGELCLLCHGSDLDPQVEARLKQLYPQDEATGFALGDIRGAYTLRFDL